MENYTIQHPSVDETEKAKKTIFGRIFKSTASRHYPGQPSTEKTLRIVYRHIMTIFPFIFAIFVLSILGIFGAYYLGANEEELSKSIPLGYLNIAGFLYIILLVFLFISVIWIWRRNKLVITNQHIVDISQAGLFNRTVATLRLEDMQDVTAKVHGPLQTIFQYGSLFIQTAGSRENFILDYIADPYDLEHYILETRKVFYNPDESAEHHEDLDYLPRGHRQTDSSTIDS